MQEMRGDKSLQTSRESDAQQVGTRAERPNPMENARSASATNNADYAGGELGLVNNIFSANEQPDRYPPLIEALFNFLLWEP